MKNNQKRELSRLEIFIAELLGETGVNILYYALNAVLWFIGIGLVYFFISHVLKDLS